MNEEEILEREAYKEIKKKKTLNLIGISIAITLIILLSMYQGAYFACKQGSGDLINFRCQEPVKLGYCVYENNVGTEFKIIPNENVTVVDYDPKANRSNLHIE